MTDITITEHILGSWHKFPGSAITFEASVNAKILKIAVQNDIVRVWVQENTGSLSPTCMLITYVCYTFDSMLYEYDEDFIHLDTLIHKDGGPVKHFYYKMEEL